MLEDYQISEQLSYVDQRLVVSAREVTISGALGAALLCALLADSEEGRQRHIAIDSSTDRSCWMQRYEAEVRSKGWGTLHAELSMLSDAYRALQKAGVQLPDLCPNDRLLDLALTLLTEYMHHLTVETFGTHIWEGLHWQAPFAQWLINAARVETRRQRFIHTNWLDAAEVAALAQQRLDEAEEPTLVFEGESAADILKRYFAWMWKTYQAQVREVPGENPKSPKHRLNVVEQETDWRFLKDEIHALSEEQQHLWQRWMVSWERYILRQLKPERPVRFWTDAVSEQQKKQLIEFLRGLERQWDYYKCLSAAIYTLRQLGYVRRTCPMTDMTRWMSDNLLGDYTLKNSRDQFCRAWKEHGRYTGEVKFYVNVLSGYGIHSLTQQKPDYDED